MSSLREIYELPERPPVPYRIWFLTLVVPALALGRWLLFPDSTASIAVLSVAVSCAVAARGYIPRRTCAQTASAAGPSTCSSSARSVGVGATL